ncbi:MAG: FAD-dependent oxidoreductase [Actinomycetota bacterium]|nr:FAD-dependent oxidoreductase [Actinomycetota bacterium]
MPEAPPPSSADVVVVGAGLAGLACARVTTAAGLHTVVLEASDRVGGRVRTDVVDGYRLDRGFQILLTAYPEARAQLDLDALDLCAFDPGALVRWHGAWHPVADPFRRPGQLWATLRSPVGTLSDKVRIGLLRQRVRRGSGTDLLRGPDRSTREGLEAAGFSSTIIERFFTPLFSGIQLDPELATSSRMFDVVFRSLSEGDSAVPAAGMQAIPDQLAAALPPEAVHLQAAVDSISGTTVTTDTGSVTGRAVVVATDGPTAAELTNLPDPGSKSVSALWFAADEAPIEGRTLLLDGEASGPVANVAVMSNVAPGYAPDGRALVVAAAPGTLAADLERSARSQLGAWFGGAVDRWDLLRVDRIVHGQPLARPPFHPKQTVRLGNARYVTGDHRDTPSIQGALFSGRRCGEAVVADLGAPG